MARTGGGIGGLTCGREGRGGRSEQRMLPPEREDLGEGWIGSGVAAPPCSGPGVASCLLCSVTTSTRRWKRQDGSRGRGLPFPLRKFIGCNYTSNIQSI
ncbi:hypothetical protein E2562_019235 [Oryza meyeriana var. granulata]|uniref:Uncharacterized protein n=1 Tax=Oryza meyeriana var. granulata TaxID=110450 RepID=A0A6G1FA20_9ORYZ|nr:hypothetical protein E2562_019235 [Oryza meyeriana var. granulata]